ncbi:MAG: hypothetical protein H6727_09890, partial [Myxococcales bacterium]|nr:hypothetical protein [Myxococcales bacterium]
GAINLWKVDEDAPTFQLTGHQKAVRDINFSRDGAFLFSISDDNTLKMWNAATGKLLLSRSLSSAPSRLCIGPNNAWLAVSNAQDGGVQLWNPETMQPTFKLNTQSLGITALACANMSQRLAVTNHNGLAFTWTCPYKAPPAPPQP